MQAQRLKEQTASTTSEVIIWLGVIVSVLIAIAWFMTVFQYQKPVLDLINNDLVSLETLIEDGCRAYSYTYSFNPSVEKGTLFINDENSSGAICISTSGISQCRKTLCNSLTRNEFDLAQVKNLVVTKTPNGNVVVSSN
jgi:hypothetical protein